MPATATTTERYLTSSHFATNHITTTMFNYVMTTTMNDLRFLQLNYHCPLDHTDFPVCYAWYYLTPTSISRLTLLYEALTPQNHVPSTLFFDIIINNAEYYLEHLATPLMQALDNVQDPFLARALLHVYGFSPKLLHAPTFYHGTQQH
jgi:hypothetical protein